MKHGIKYLANMFKFFAIVLLLFGGAFFYLHQKVLCLVEAYELTDEYRTFSDLQDRKDYLKYHFFRKTSLDKVNQWTEDNDFRFVGKEKVVALNVHKGKSSARENKFASLFDRFLGSSANIPKALARDRE